VFQKRHRVMEKKDCQKELQKMREKLSLAIQTFRITELDPDMKMYVRGIFARDPRVCFGNLRVAGTRRTVSALLCDWVHGGNAYFEEHEPKIGDFGWRTVIIGGLQEYNEDPSILQST
jgi:hypothetical protein